MRHLYLISVFIIILCSCKKSDDSNEVIENKTYKVASIIPSSTNEPSTYLEYSTDGKLKKIEFSGEYYATFEYTSNNVIRTEYNLYPGNGAINAKKSTQTYTLNTSGNAISSTTLYADGSTMQGTYTYDNNGYLIKGIEGEEELRQVVNNDNFSSATGYYRGNLEYTNSFEIYADKQNNSNIDFFGGYDIYRTGIDFLGKRGMNLVKKSSFSSSHETTSKDYSYTFDSKGRISRYTLSNGVYYDITYVQ